MRKLSLLLLVLPALHFGQFTQAQSAPQGYLALNADSSGYHWRILTDVKSRNTEVQFFGNGSELLYKEDVPEKYIKQNKRTQRRLNKLLSDISANKLVIARLKTEELPSDPAKSKPTHSSQSLEADASKMSYRIHVSINAEGKVRVAVDNPESIRYKIEIADYRDRVVYQEFTSHDQYRRHIDISPILADSAQVILSIDKKRFVYRVEREKMRNAYKVNAVIAQR
ncbi:hypothetical protein DYBT9623_00752 [Dyadobacter sp. CECT 9623]|uniref:Uncharacterized protein n=1 Tax=Dyadobacter linearis TaxID=2823330 RepID=A0ABN7R7D9_9BACT|nr:hypothetical protein [Dyadobacter sp. CECT 9623]CAG5068024.1 hypothetical protein DYBT9623_00752 [Dyadobacter sp. CECT 9623]